MGRGRKGRDDAAVDAAGSGLARVRAAPRPPLGRNDRTGRNARNDRNGRAIARPEDARGAGGVRWTHARVAFALDPRPGWPPSARAADHAAADHRQADGHHRARGARPDRRARGEHPRAALRHAPRVPFDGGQRLPGSHPERAPRDGGSVRRHRPGTQRRPVRGRGQLRTGGPRRRQAATHRTGAEVRAGGHGAGHEGPDGWQGRSPHGAGLAPGQVPRPRTRPGRLGDLPPALGRRPQAAEVDPEQGEAEATRRDRPDGRGGRLRGGDHPGPASA